MRSIPKSSAEITFLVYSLQFPHTSMLLPNNQLLHSRWLFFVFSLESVHALLPVCIAALYRLRVFLQPAYLSVLTTTRNSYLHAAVLTFLNTSLFRCTADAGDSRAPASVLASVRLACAYPAFPEL